jgi:dCMP deaminase
LAPGSSNELEYTDLEGNLVTKEETIHAELSAVLRAAREGVSVVGGTLYTTMSCCKPCSEMVAAAGISRVVYKETYRDTSGIENLKNLGVIVEKFKED